MPKLKKAVLKFNIEDNLSLRYGHKLRGFFANRFKNILFHHHKENGDYRYAYPLIQYKIIDGKPTVIGLNRGAELVSDKFLDIDKLNLGDKEYINLEEKLSVIDEELAVVSDIAMPKFKYTFLAPWMGLNQRNHKRYLKQVKDDTKNKQIEFFGKIITGNILTFAKGVDWWIDEEIIVVPDLKEIEVKFKNNIMLGFVGEFYSNVSLPEYIGLGKSTARGFGMIAKEELI